MLLFSRCSPAFFKCLPFGILAVAAARCEGQTLYSFGNPNAGEQLYIELINRARANPAAEGIRLAASTDPDVLGAYSLYSVDLTMLKSELAGLSAAPPLAPNASLTASARVHSQWMLDNAVQSHNETNPANDPTKRMTDAGYVYSSIGENVFAYVKNVAEGHAGFEVDWGTGGTGGMQAGRGHRVNNHNPVFKEIGVGMVTGTNGPVGPELVTQDFGSPAGGKTFGTGVAYYDLNGNDFYDAGEGIAGLTVNVGGATDYCLTAAGGGWAVPVPQTAATRTVTFAGLGISETRTLVVPASANAKADLKLTYTPPSITSATTGAAATARTFAFTTVAGATGYRWKRSAMTPAAAENCDSLADVTASTMGTYSPLNTAVKQEGSASFHLANPGMIGQQTIELNHTFHGEALPELTFQSKLLYATADERYTLQVKEEGSVVWQEIYGQTGGTKESAFSQKTIPLPGMAGKSFRIRLALNFPGGSTYGSADDIFGWFVDAISFNGITTLSPLESQLLTASSTSFTPVAGSYLLSVAPVISGVEFPGTSQFFTATEVQETPGFGTWASAIEIANGLPAGALADSPAADFDADGSANLVEYAFGTSPVGASDASSRMPVLRDDGSDLVLRYVRDTGLADVTIVPVASPDLKDWRSPGQAGAPAGFTDTAISTEGNLETREARIPRGASAAWFMKMQVTQP